MLYEFKHPILRFRSEYLPGVSISFCVCRKVHVWWCMMEIYIRYMLLPTGYKVSYWVILLLSQLAAGLPFCLCLWLWRWRYGTFRSTQESADFDVRG